MWRYTRHLTFTLSLGAMILGLVVLTGATKPALALPMSIYWSETLENAGTIWRANPDGSGVVVIGPHRARSLALAG